MQFTILECKKLIASNKCMHLFREETDLIGTRKLIHKTIEVCYSAYYEGAVVNYIKDIYKNENIIVRAMKGITIVYLIENKIVGTGSLTDDQITGLFIDPAFQRRGIGKRMMYSLLCEAKNQKLSKLSLQATPGSEGFFNQLGFHTISEENFWIEDIFLMDLYEMEKKL